jgi:hypothetical protein
MSIPPDRGRKGLSVAVMAAVAVLSVLAIGSTLV